MGVMTGLPAIISASGGSGYALPASLYDEMFSWWSFDEATGTGGGLRIDTHTQSPNNYFFDPTTMPHASSGIVGNCVNCNGGTDYLQCDNPRLNTGDWDYSWSLWIYTNTLTGDAGIITCGNGSTLPANNHMLIYRQGSELKYYTSDGTGTWTTVQKTIAASTWYHVVVTNNAATKTMSLIVNNGTPATTTYTTHASGIATHTRVGMYPSPVYFYGKIDELAHWERVLTASEITALYNGGAGTGYADLPPFIPSYLPDNILWLDASNRGVTTDQWDDLSGNANHFTKTSGYTFPTFTNGVALFNGSTTSVVGPNLMTAATDAEVQMLIQRDPSGGTGIAIGWLDWGTDGGSDHYTYNIDQVITAWGTTARKNMGIPPFNLNDWQRIMINNETNNWYCKANRADLYSTGTSTISYDTAPSIGSSIAENHFLYGGIKDFIVCQPKLSEGPRYRVDRFLQEQLIITDNLQSWWDFGEASGTRYDSTASNNDLIITGSISQTTGVVGNAVQSTSNTARLYRTGASGYANGGDLPFAICFWIYPVTIASYGIIAQGGNGISGNVAWQISFDVTAPTTLIPRWAIKTVSGTPVYEILLADHISPIPNGSWSMIYAYWNPELGEQGISVNAGVRNARVTNSVCTSTARIRGMSFFNDYAVTTYPCQARLDSFGIWDRTLRQDEIEWLYNSGAGRAYADL